MGLTLTMSDLPSPLSTITTFKTLKCPASFYTHRLTSPAPYLYHTWLAQHPFYTHHLNLPSPFNFTLTTWTCPALLILHSPPDLPSTLFVLSLKWLCGEGLSRDTDYSNYIYTTPDLPSPLFTPTTWLAQPFLHSPPDLPSPFNFTLTT
jgi:hypothetical protein